MCPVYFVTHVPGLHPRPASSTDFRSDIAPFDVTNVVKRRQRDPPKFLSGDRGAVAVSPSDWAPSAGAYEDAFAICIVDARTELGLGLLELRALVPAAAVLQKRQLDQI